MFATLLDTRFTTAFDRMGRYLISLKLVVSAYLPEALGRQDGRNTFIVGAILCYYTVVLFVGLNFAAHCARRVPYQMILSLS